MKETGILFKADMVRAILEGRKTQTRRIVKPPKKWIAEYPYLDPWAMNEPGVTWWWNGVHKHVGVSQECPYGKPGDRLWVRETFSVHPEIANIAYRADGEEFEDSDGFMWVPKWTPSIHMPRGNSRIDLEITNVRIERLQDISEEDAQAEGCTKNHNGYYWAGPHQEYGLKQLTTAIRAYRDLWESINGPGSWDKNPWVWVIEFERKKV